MNIRRFFKRAALPREILIIFLSAIGALIISFSLITYGQVRSPQVAYALMFWVYSHCYLLLKKYFLKKSLALRALEFEAVSLVLTSYMVVLLQFMKDQPEIVQLPACYWTFIFISVYVSLRGGRHNKVAAPNGGPAPPSVNSDGSGEGRHR